MSIVIENLSYVYSPKTPFEHKALDNISLTVEDGDFLGIIGATGSGKSTFIQHLNGLIKLTSGKITVDRIELHNKPDLKKLRAEVGMVFQYPEYQLFDETVEKDVSFGHRNPRYDCGSLSCLFHSSFRLNITDPPQDFSGCFFTRCSYRSESGFLLNLMHSSVQVQKLFLLPRK